MLFSSITFLYYFLPVMLLAYFITPAKLKNVTLLIGSLVFYFSGEPKYTLLLVFSTIVAYSHSLIIYKYRGKRSAKLALISSIIINLFMLFFFKYSDFFIINVNHLIGTNFSTLALSLPIGISFFTFQTMSYTIDVYREEAEPQKNLLNLVTYVALFPQLIAGPIVRYKTIAKELNNRTHSYDNFSCGVHRFMIGLGKKVLIANTLGELSEIAKTTPHPSVAFYWIGSFAFALQIYYDFSGYSDMAIGLGRMFGFHFLENFNYPYISASISEFWNRWHMSLGRWFKDYVYIPLGGNKKSRLKWVRNIFIVWFLTGFWHGSSWNFILWGLYLGTFIILEKWFMLKLLEKLPKVFRHLYVVFIIVISFVLFNNDTMTSLTAYFSGLFGLLDIPFISHQTIYYAKSYTFIFLLSIIGATPFVSNTTMKLVKSEKIKSLFIVVPLFYITLLLIITGYLVDASFNPFLYFRF